MELTDRGECCLRPREHQEAHGVRDDNRRRRPHPDSERTEHGCVGEQRRLEWREALQSPGGGVFFCSPPPPICRPPGPGRGTRGDPPPPHHGAPPPPPAPPPP